MITPPLAASHTQRHIYTLSTPCLLGAGVETRISLSLWRLTHLHHIWWKQGALLRKELFQILSGAQCINIVTGLLSFREDPVKDMKHEQNIAYTITTITQQRVQHYSRQALTISCYKGSSYVITTEMLKPIHYPYTRMWKQHI